MPPCAEKMVLVNLSRTRADRKAALVFRMECDPFMKKLVSIFGTQMGEWSYVQEFDVKYDTQDMENWKVKFIYNLQPLHHGSFLLFAFSTFVITDP